MKLKHSIMGKLWLYMTVLIVLALIFAGIVLTHSFSDFYFKIRENELINEGQQLIALLFRGINPNELLDISKFINAHSVIVDREGLIKFSASTVDFHGLAIDGKEFEKVLRGHTLVYKGYTPQFNAPMLTVALPIKTEREVVGSLILYSPMASIQNSLYNIRRLVVMTVLGAVLISTIASLFLSKKVSKPLVKMKEVAEDMAQGVFDEKVEVSSEDEVGALAEALNYLSTALKDNINALSQEKHQLQQVLVGMSDGVMTFDTKGKLVLENPQAKALLANSKGEIDYSLLEPILEDALKLQDYSPTEIELSGKTISIRRAPLREDEDLWGVVLVLQDISLERKTQVMRREFLGNVSHELRTPLACLQGYAEALLDGMAQDPQEETKYLNIILDETLRLRRMVDELLALARTEEGQLTLKTSLVSAQEILQGIGDKFAPIARKKGVEIKAKGPDETLWLELDRDGTEQVLTNLVDNAMKLSEKGNKILISVKAKNDMVVFSVRDEGPGIPEEELPYIFDRFYKVDKSRTRSGGVGIGLSIVKGIVKAHGGEVWAKNLEKKGAVFSFSLPRAKQ